MRGRGVGLQGQDSKSTGTAGEKEAQNGTGNYFEFRREVEKKRGALGRNKKKTTSPGWVKKGGGRDEKPILLQGLTERCGINQRGFSKGEMAEPLFWGGLTSGNKLTPSRPKQQTRSNTCGKDWGKSGETGNFLKGSKVCKRPSSKRAPAEE